MRKPRYFGFSFGPLAQPPSAMKRRQAIALKAASQSARFRGTAGVLMKVADRREIQARPDRQHVKPSVDDPYHPV
jgi:hypothetical protein